MKHNFPIGQWKEEEPIKTPGFSVGGEKEKRLFFIGGIPLFLPSVAGNGGHALAFLSFRRRNEMQTAPRMVRIKKPFQST